MVDKMSAKSGRRRIQRMMRNRKIGYTVANSQTRRTNKPNYLTNDLVKSGPICNHRNRDSSVEKSTKRTK